MADFKMSIRRNEEEEMREEGGINLRNRSNNNKNNNDDVNVEWMSSSTNAAAAVKYAHFEEVLDQVNPFGAYQIFVCICIVFAQVEWGGNFSFINLVGSVEPDWQCVLAGGNSTTTIFAPTNEASCEFIRTNCTGIEPIRNSTEFYSIVASLRLICEDGDKPEAIQILQAIALMVGSIVGGHVGDRFGRQCLFYICQLGVVITSCLTIASTSWIFYAICQSINGFLYGILEVESLTLVMEYTNNHYRMIPVACFVQHIANMITALIAHFTRDWQMFFVFLNLLTSPIIMAFMLFHESPRWLVARGMFSEATHVLNDLAGKRWNGTGAVFSQESLSGLPHEPPPMGAGRRLVSFRDLFSRARFAKQSLMQILSMCTYSMIGICYFYVIRDFPFSSINIMLLDGLFRLGIPILVILLDMHVNRFTRRLQFLLSLSLMGLCFGVVLVLVGLFKMDHLHWVVVIFVVIGGMLNGSLFWMNIVQVTTQRYPTLIRCIAFGCLHSLRHIGTIAGILITQPLMETAHHPIFNFFIPFVLILVTLGVGLFLQPETKGKALLDTLEELDYARVESVVPKALHKMAEMQAEIHRKIGTAKETGKKEEEEG